MKVRFGYVAMSVQLVNCSPSKTVTFKNYRGLSEKDPEAALNKLKRISRENLCNTLRLLRHNLANGVMIYRFSSKIIPLATHPELSDWDYIEDLKENLKIIGKLVNESNMRVSFHPDHYSLINSPREEVFNSSMADFLHHCRVLDAMGLGENAKLVTHVGGAYKNKKNSLEIFVANWEKIPPAVASRITLENDDKIYTALDTLGLCERINVPMVLDLHHHFCNHEDHSQLEDIVTRFVQTWKGTGLPPKIHVSSPKSNTEIRSHSDYVNPGDVFPFLKIMAQTGEDIDIMVEAKQKDDAMFRLVKELSALPGLKQINRAVIETVR